MALIRCPDCDAEISDQAAACIKCGRPAKLSSPAAKQAPYEPKSSGVGTIIFVAIGVVILVTVLGPSIKRGYNGYLAKNGTGKQSADVEGVRRKASALNNLAIEYTWKKGGFNSALILDVTIKNSSKEYVKDIEITCESRGNSGTAIDSNTRVLYEAVAPEFHKTVKDFNMGFIAGQVSATSCTIKDAVIF